MDNYITIEHLNFIANTTSIIVIMVIVYVINKVICLTSKYILEPFSDVLEVVLKFAFRLVAIVFVLLYVINLLYNIYCLVRYGSVPISVK